MHKIKTRILFIYFFNNVVDENRSEVNPDNDFRKGEMPARLWEETHLLL